MSKIKILGDDEEDGQSEFTEVYKICGDEAEQMMFFYNKEMIEEENTKRIRFDRQDKPVEVKFMVKPIDKNNVEEIKNKWLERLHDLKSYVLSNKTVEEVKTILKRFGLQSDLLPLVSKNKDGVITVFGRNDKLIDKLKRASESDAPEHAEGKQRVGSFRTEDDKMKLEFCTQEGLIVKVYKAPITKLEVDAIVNAANDTLSNIGGVALVIANAAGREMERECKEKVSKHGPVPDGDNRVTTAGRLSYRAVINAVGPRWSDYNDKEKCLQILIKTVVNIMETARGCGYTRIAMPPISSGIFGVPKRLCAAMYLNGIFRFSSRNNFGSLKEFHIIDIQDEVLDMITDFYRTYAVNPNCLTISNLLTNVYDKGSGFDRSVNTRQKESRNTTFDEKDGYAYGGRKEHVRQDSIGEQSGKPGKLNNVVFKSMHSQTDIHIYSKDILQLKNVDVVVVSENKTFDGIGGLAKLLLQHGGTKYKKEHNKHKKCFFSSDYKVGKVIITGGGDLPFRHVFHAVVERIPYYLDALYLKQVQRTILEILSTADGLKENHVKGMSLAIPMIGAGSYPDLDTLQSYCNAISEAIWKYLGSNKRTKIRHIHLVNIDDNITMMLRQIFERHRQRGPPPTRQHRPSAATKDYMAPLNDLKLIDSWNVDNKITPKSIDFSKYFDAVGRTDLAPKGNLVILGDVEETDADDENCVICLCKMQCPVQLNDCKHKFCKECITEFFMTKSSCPVCGTVYGKMYGDQPREGTAKVYLDPTSLPGYEGKKTYMIIYDFPAGKQESYHPDPGEDYEGFKRRAFLPDCPEGKQVLQLLKRAFEQGITFTIGTSRTTGKEGVITWNDIHHKTSKTGGPQKFGYPDPEYLERVKEELACKGII